MNLKWSASPSMSTALAILEYTPSVSRNTVAEGVNALFWDPDAYRFMCEIVGGQLTLAFLWSWLDHSRKRAVAIDTRKKKRRGGSAHRVHKKPVRAVHDPASPFPEMVDAKEVAKALLCSPQHVYALAAAGRLPHSRRDGRPQFPVDGIKEHLRDHEVA
jgi:hypothetical protein